MADGAGQAEIRGLDIQKAATGFADEDLVFSKFVTNTTTSAREIRWYKKQSGFLSGSKTTGLTTELIDSDQLARPTVLRQLTTRETSHVRKWIAESEWLSDEDIKDSDIDILMMSIRDITRGVGYQKDKRIWEVMSDLSEGVNLVNISGAWAGLTSDIDPITDIMDGKQLIRQQGYNPEGGKMFMNSYAHSKLLSWLISVKGSSIPQFSSAALEKGVVMGLLGLGVVVSENVTDGFILLGQPKVACTWKSFIPITAVTIKDPGIGTKIRVWEEGEAILRNPKAMCLLSGSGTQ